MNSIESLIDNSSQRSDQENEITTILELSNKLDLIDVQILRKFYSTGRDFPDDTQPFCFPVLYLEMKTRNNLQLGMEGLRKRLDVLVKLGLLEKVKNSNPVSYFPVKERENLIRACIMRFFVINGLTKFL